ncbi:MAG TPA: NAD-dependent epimerase/dehydratase family protein [Pirellulaceae bacterium]|jgi:nucleoside-diphosphate-sugar epimerase|nr:NAD-dependent epimerase/dehydratase family protein [Pirellulaceae bacterium]
MSDALFGYTGFVGSALARAKPFDAFFNSRNLEEARGRSFETVYCAAMPAAKWIANREPEADRLNLDRLISTLETVRAETFVLASTVDVYPAPRGVDESTTIDESSCHPYGLHRLLLERFVAERFNRRVIVRLPALFGVGLKKNAIYDLLHDNQIHLIHPDSRYQFYDIGRMADDCDRFSAADLDLVNLATEPVAMGEIAATVFGKRLTATESGAATYDFRSRYAERFGGTGGYFLDREATLADLRKFVERERSERR